MTSINDRYERYAATLNRFGQSHLLAFWPRLSDEQRVELMEDIDQVDFELCASLTERYVVEPPPAELPARLEPATALPEEPASEHARMYADARRLGEEAIRTGQVAAFTVAGGQGTRLGYDGPKGAFPISPVRSVPLFQLFAESLLGIERRYGRRPRWYIMTSPGNHADTQAFFAEHSYFGLTPDDVMFFPQGQMPAFHPDGRIALSRPHRLALGPDGHGGSLRALARSGALADMRARGIEHISYFQVDNPLVRAVDPLFVGLHALTGSEMSSKAVTKADDTERVGNFCLTDGRLAVIEYTDLPEELAHARRTTGGRLFDAGNIAIHVLSREFVERITGSIGDLTLPWHRAEKKLPTVNAFGDIDTPSEPNVVKLEMFVFDALPLARNPLLIYTRRAEEFSPVKNAEGVDSAATARRDMVRRAARWLEYCGCAVPRTAAGEPDLPLEISPAYALDEEDLKARLHQLPALRRGTPYLLG
jgi:UDP-N-acetylglucosamine/UDP-N-acetylgalactosamine diphosphorylase